VAGCGHCGGCCAPCAMSCGTFGGLGIAGMGMGPRVGGDNGDYGGLGFSGYRSFGSIIAFHHWFGSHHTEERDETAKTVDTRALADPEHPGHRDAIKAISHVDPVEHTKLIEWLKKELPQAGEK
jgi:hypothetical protein